jgi:rhamnose utilization protein RhaD (predicted bifunctional aldolase and dehydrogenase)/enoyl-[acyl-carrier-protein] reductase (NADH)
MGTIEPAGLPAVRIAPLRKLRGLERLTDEDMVNFQRVSLLDSRAPNPSVETLLHAFLPHKFVDHTHAAAVLSLVDQPHGAELAAEVYGTSMGLVPYVIPGFSLAKLAADVYDANPAVEGLILLKHGIFTFGADAREAYERMIAHVSRAEARLAKGRRNVFAPAALPAALASPAEVAPILRGAVAVPPAQVGGEPGRFILDFRSNAGIRNYVDGTDLAGYAQRGVVTPDHVIRTKNLPLLVPAPQAGKLDDFAAKVREAVADYAARYDAMFARQNARVGGIKAKLDASPRVVLVPGLGLFGLGATAKDAAIAADLAENAIRVITDAEAIGRYEPLGEADLFDVEYWSLEQAKLKGTVAKVFTGQVAVVTGAGSGIGLAAARALAAEVREAVADYAARYDAMFARQNARVGASKTKLDASPRVILVPGLGLFGLGATAKDAAIAADLAENTIRVITDAEAIGRYAPLGEADLFDVEYWSLEQAKLKGAISKAFTGQVAVVTGAGSGIGFATAKALVAEGAAVALLDLDGTAASAAVKAVGGPAGVLGFACDVTNRAQVAQAFARITEAFGGVDIVVSNAGAAWQGRIGEVAEDVLRESFELNFFAHQAVAQAAVRIMLRQGTGGVLLFNISKQAVNPGPAFGPYGLPKAATLALMRQYAIDYGAAGIRANGVNADRIRTGLLTDEMVASRAKARGVSQAEYMRGNLLNREVTAADVAQAFVALAKARATTGHIETVDGGNIAAALR